MNDEIVFSGDDRSVSPEEYVAYFKIRYPDEDVDLHRIADVLRQSILITARQSGRLIGFVRILCDGYLFAAVTEAWAEEPLYRDRSFWEKILMVAASTCPTRIVLATHRTDPELLKELGWEYGLPSYVYRKKPRVAK